MSVILSQTFMCKRCRLLAPMNFANITPDGLLCHNCSPPTTQQQRDNEAEAWLVGVLDGTSDEEDDDSTSAEDDDNARAGFEPPTSEKT